MFSRSIRIYSYCNVKNFTSALLLSLFVFNLIITSHSLSTIYAEESLGVEAIRVQAAEEKTERMLGNGKFAEGEVVYKFKGNEKLRTKTGVSDIREEIKTKLLDERIEYAHPNYIYEMAWTDSGSESKPNDYNDSRHWYYSRASVPELWDEQDCPGGGLCGGSSDVTVAVIDSGLIYGSYDDSAGLTGVNFQMSSPEYSGINLHNNSAETPGDGIDNDCNGYVDDIHGVDTYNQLLAEGVNPGTSTCTGGNPNTTLPIEFAKSGAPVDTHGHGSMVTGTIASATNNSASSVSPGFELTIMPIAANAHFERTFFTSPLANAIRYARLNGADIINMSLGGEGELATAIENEINAAIAAGILVVAASGNTGGGIVATDEVYPAAYDNVLSVGAIDPDDERSFYSVYGSKGVDIVAYVGSTGSSGGAVWQTTLSCYSSCATDGSDINSGVTEQFSIGTSFAAPQVAALAGIIKSKNPNWGREELKEVIEQTAVDVGASGNDLQTGNGRIDFLDSYIGDPEVFLDIYRFWSSRYRAHFYTSSSAERDSLINSDPNWAYEGVAYQSVSLNTCFDTTPVYRFWSSRYRAHFYTSSTAERDLVINSNPNWQYEGAVFCVYQASGSGRVPVYRFWSERYRAHFYTSSTAERDLVINSNPNWEYEGVSYYVIQ
ncbi:MAG: S8 family serine peptidase [Candidatus Dojkabacteria bacterium]